MNEGVTVTRAGAGAGTGQEPGTQPEWPGRIGGSGEPARSYDQRDELVSSSTGSRMSKHLRTSASMSGETCVGKWLERIPEAMTLARSSAVVAPASNQSAGLTLSPTSG